MSNQEDKNKEREQQSSKEVLKKRATREQKRKRANQIRNRIVLSIVLILILILVSVIFLIMESKQKDHSSIKGPIIQEERLTLEETESQETSSEKDVQGTQNAIEANQELATENRVDTEKSTLIFTGDVLFSSYVLANYETAGIDGVVSMDIQTELKDADIVMMNQEFPFGTGGTKALDKQYTFKVNPSYLSLLQELQADIVTLANNHVLDFGTEVLEETFLTLEKGNIAYVGAGTTYERAKQLQVIEKNGMNFGFLGASRVFPVESWNAYNHAPGVFSTYDQTALVQEINDAKHNCDFLTVFVHWGIERATMPEEYQRTLAKAYIDAGADIVIGSHPHVLQGIEFYKGKPIFYSLGNFIFNQTIEKTMLVKVSVENEIVNLSVIPARADGAYTSKISEEEIDEFSSYLENLSFDGVKIEKGNITYTLE